MNDKKDFSEAELTKMYAEAERHFNVEDPGPYAEVLDLIDEVRRLRKERDDR